MARFDLALTRRWLLAAGIAGTVTALLPYSARAGTDAAVCAACLRGADGRYAVALLNAEGAIVARAPLPDRGHGIAASPDGRRIVAFARRPGRFAVSLDVASGVAGTAFAAPGGRHFYGHGVYSPDGALLYAPENDFDAGVGVIGVYDATANFARVDEMPGGGIGPHEAVLLEGGAVLAVAVGGIATHPDSGRRKLNLPTMAPALVYLDRRSGRLLERVELPSRWHQLSLRHLVADATGAVWIGGQYEGPATDELPLVWRHRRGGALAAAEGFDAGWPAWRQYVGAVAVSHDGAHIVATSPRGGIAAVWQAADGRLATRYRIEDVCGVAAGPGAAMLLSDGRGRVWRDGTELSADAGLSWDNHMTALQAA